MDHAGHQLVKRRVFEICKVHYKHVIIDKKKKSVKVESYDHKVGGVKWISLDATLQADSCYTLILYSTYFRVIAFFGV